MGTDQSQIRMRAVAMPVGAKKCLEIGPGGKGLDGFETVDVVDRKSNTYTAIWGESPLPIEEGIYDEVYASHVLEHVPWFQTNGAICDVFRILKPGGFFEVWVPDFLYIVNCYRDGSCGDKWRKHNSNADPMMWVNGRIFTYGPNDPNWHRACFDEAYLGRCLEAAGFVEVNRLARRQRGTSHGSIDLGMQATKPIR